MDFATLQSRQVVALENVETLTTQLARARDFASRITKRLKTVVRIPAGPLGSLKCDPPKGNGRRPQKKPRYRSVKGYLLVGELYAYPLSPVNFKGIQYHCTCCFLLNSAATRVQACATNDQLDHERSMYMMMVGSWLA